MACVFLGGEDEPCPEPHATQDEHSATAPSKPKAVLLDVIRIDSLRELAAKPRASNNKTHVAAGFDYQITSVYMNAAPPPAALATGRRYILFEVIAQKLLQVGRETLPRNSKYGSRRRDELSHRRACGCKHLVDGVRVSHPNAHRSFEMGLVGGERRNVSPQYGKCRRTQSHQHHQEFDSMGLENRRGGVFPHT